MSSIDKFGKKILSLGVFLTLSASCALANTLSEVQINATDSGYDIVLKTENSAQMKKIISSNDKMSIELKDVQASEALNTVYNNVANIDNVTIQPISKNDLKLTFQGDEISKSKVYFENIKTNASVLPSTNQSIELSQPMNTYKPVYNPKDFVEEENTNEGLTAVLSAAGVNSHSLSIAKKYTKKALKKVKNSANGFDINIMTIMGVLLIAGALLLKPKSKQTPKQQIGLAKVNQEAVNREISLNDDLHSLRSKLQQTPASTANYGVKAYQQSQRNPYMTANTPGSGISGIPRKSSLPRPVASTQTQTIRKNSAPIQQSKLMNNTIQTKKPIQRPSMSRPIENDSTEIDSMKFLETITKIYEKNGRNDLAKGLKDNLKKAQMVKQAL